MNGKKLLLAGLSAALLVGAAAQVSFAAPQGNDHMGGPGGRWHGPRFSPEVLYVRMLKEFDTKGDAKITKDEVKAGVDKIFDQIDTGKTGEITRAELRTYGQERMKEWKAAHPKPAGDQAQANQAQGDQAQAGQTDGDQAQGDQDKGDHKDGGGHHGHKHHGRFMREPGLFGTILRIAHFDHNPNSQISKQEVEDAANLLFDRMDRNHDGVISLDDMPDRPLP